MSIPIICDHDAGTNPDDTFALIYLIKSKANLAMTISGNRFPLERARFCKLVLDNENVDIPCFVGEEAGCVDFYCHKDISEQKVENNYLDAVFELLKNNEQINYLAIAGLTNLKKIIDTFPEQLHKLNIIHMGLSTNGFDSPIVGGTNMQADQVAAKYVYQYPNLNIKSVGLQTTLNPKIKVDDDIISRLKQSKLANHVLLVAQLEEFLARRKILPHLHDPLAASEVLDKNFIEYRQVFVDFLDNGQYQKGTNTIVCVSEKVKYDEFKTDFISKLFS